MAASEMPGCYCCAEVVGKNPLEYRFVNRMIRLENSTINKKLAVLACPQCDEPLLANARQRAGREIEND